MTSQDERTKDGRALGANLLDGAALVVVAPIIIPALLLGCRSVAKTVLKGSLFLTDAVKQLALATSEGWGDLLAEARSQARTAPAPEGVGSMGKPAPPTHAAPVPDTTPHAAAVELQSIPGLVVSGQPCCRLLVWTRAVNWPGAIQHTCMRNCSRSTNRNTWWTSCPPWNRSASGLRRRKARQGNLGRSMARRRVEGRKKSHRCFAYRSISHSL